MNKQDINQVKKEVKKIQKKSKGQSLVEYGLILALVSVVAITVLQTMGGQIKQTINQVSGQLKQANETAKKCAASTDPDCT